MWQAAPTEWQGPHDRLLAASVLASLHSADEPMSTLATPAPTPPRSALAAVLLVELHRVVPVDRFHVGVDIAGGGSAVVHVIGVLVHVEHEHRPPAGKRRR